MGLTVTFRSILVDSVSEFLVHIKSLFLPC